MHEDDGHRYFEGLAVAHVLGGLDDSEGRVFRAHLLECSSCRARVGELRAIAHDLADVERDERRVRAAQAIDTKRREADEEVDEATEAVPSARSSRITVVVGLVMILGLSLWNFTLRSHLEVIEADNANLVEAGVLADSGEPWSVTREVSGVEATVKSKDDSFVLVMDGLDEEQYYGLYAETDTGVVASNWTLPPPDGGRVYTLLTMPADATRITVTNPVDEDGKIAYPGNEPSGAVIFEATRPVQ
jgi:hypothetical protein